MTDYKIAYLKMTDAKNARYHVPEWAVPSSDLNPTMRMEMLGFQLNKDVFSWSFTDLSDSSNVYITT